jgi:hypothetical protein
MKTAGEPVLFRFFLGLLLWGVQHRMPDIQGKATGNCSVPAQNEMARYLLAALR